MFNIIGLSNQKAEQRKKQVFCGNHRLVQRIQSFKNNFLSSIIINTKNSN